MSYLIVLAAVAIMILAVRIQRMQERVDQPATGAA